MPTRYPDVPDREGLDVRFGDRSDEELIRLAQAGWAPAFAVLVHRYAPVVRATRPRAEPAVPFLTHVFLQAMRELRGRDPQAPVAPWLLGLADAGARSARPPVPLEPEELDDLWTRLHRSWPDGRRHGRAIPWRRTAAVVGLAAIAGLVPAVVLGADGNGVEGEPLELRAVPVPDERTVEVAEEPDDEPDFSFPTTPEAQDAPQEAPPAEPVAPPSEPESAGPEPEPEPQDPTPGEDDDPDGQDEETTPDEGTEDDEDSGGLLDGVLGGNDDGNGDGSNDGDDPQGSDEGPVEEHGEEDASGDGAASGESEGS